MSDEALARSWHELMGRYNRLACRLDRELGSAHGLSSSEFEVLQQLDACAVQGELRMADLAHRVHLSQSALSRLVGRLERDGLVLRAACEADRRSVWIRITDAGRTRCAEARPTQRAILRTETWCAAQLPPGDAQPAGPSSPNHPA
ncbi:MarR family transcriptional regulator [Kineococcus glutinatus]|uniref:MarR family transcriptional regulator n=1 Tax=Kineococcus glutinatus TaxID=1070872 RepID=A0ABP9I5B2_9ACTN